MDNWHVTPRLSLQLGLRYDALPHAWERNNEVANFDPAALLASQQSDLDTGRHDGSRQPGFQTVNGSPVLPERHRTSPE